MKRSRFTEEQIIGMTRNGGGGLPTSMPLAYVGRQGKLAPRLAVSDDPGTNAGLPDAPLSCLALRGLRVPPPKLRARKPEQRTARDAESEWKKLNLKS